MAIAPFEANDMTVELIWRLRMLESLPPSPDGPANTPISLAALAGDMSGGSRQYSMPPWYCDALMLRMAPIMPSMHNMMPSAPVTTQLNTRILAE